MVTRKFGGTFVEAGFSLCGGGESCDGLLAVGVEVVGSGFTINTT